MTPYSFLRDNVARRTTVRLANAGGDKIPTLNSRRSNSFLGDDAQARLLFDEANRYLPGGNTRSTVFVPPWPPYAASGSGYELTDVDGETRIDFLNNYTSLLHGHADPSVIAAVSAQLAAGTAFGFPTEHEIRLAKAISNRVDSIDLLRFTNSGTEAVMLAIQIARAFTGRSKIAKFEGAYHGGYDYAAVSVAPGPHEWGPPDHPTSVPDRPGTPASVSSDVVVLPSRDPSAVEALLHTNRADLAAILIDPLANRAGLVPTDPRTLEVLEGVAGRYGILLIVDEVLTFRLSYGGAQERFGVQPDLTALGKIIGGGLPIGAVGGRADVMGVSDPRRRPHFSHGGTFNANPLSMVAGEAALEKWTPTEVHRVNALGARLRERLQLGMEALGLEGRVSGDGSLARLHLSADHVTDYRSSVSLTNQDRMSAWYRGMLERGFVTSPQGLICISTPMGEMQIDAFVDAAVECAAIATRTGRN